MNNKYFKNAIEWSEENTNIKGLPRPFAYTDPNGKNKKNVKKLKLAKIVPIPWQSKSNFINNGFLLINEKNEKQIYSNDLCPYCGLKINKKELSIRWKTVNLKELVNKPTLVYSDIHPFHIECMQQGRIFCPFMKKLNDEDFEIETFEQLKYNAILEKRKAKK